MIIMKNVSKTIILIAAIFFGTQTISAQGFIHVGYNAGFPTKLDNLNYVIQRYNETRPFLDVQMKEMSYLDGTTLTIGGILGPLFVGIGYTGGGQKRYAEGIDNTGILMRRDLKCTMHAFDMDMGLVLRNDADGALYLGGSFSFGGFAVKTRVAPESEIRQAEWQKINLLETTLFNLGIFVRFAFAQSGFYIQPYYMFTPGELFKNDMTDVNSYLNPNTYISDTTPLNVGCNTLGIKCGFGFVGN